MDPIAAEIANQFKVVHGQLRDEVRGRAVHELNWKPAPDTNSIAALVVHTLGSEAEVFRIVANVPSERDRPAEFLATANKPDELVEQLDRADALLDELLPHITAADMAAARPRGDRPPETGLHWLLTNYGHTREHLAHIQLTRQMYALQQAEKA